MRGMLAARLRHMPLRTQITVATVLVLVVGLLTSALGVTAVLRSYLVDNLDMQLSQVLSHVNTDTVNNDQNAAATQFAFAHFAANGTLIQANPPWSDAKPKFDSNAVTRVRNARPSISTISDMSEANMFRVAARTLPDNTVVVLGAPMSNIDQLLNRLFTLFLLFGLVVVTVGIGLIRLLVTSAFRPLRQVEHTAAAIADGDFGQRLGDATPDTEVGRLNQSLNRMLGRIDAALSERSRTIDQMRRFVSDASHELRTPLVSVRGYAELYRMGALQSKEDITQAMDRIEREAIRLSTLVSDLLTLARLDEGRTREPKPVELLPLAYDAVLDTRVIAPGRDIRVVGHGIPVTSPVPKVAPRTTDNAQETGRFKIGGTRGKRSITSVEPTAIKPAHQADQVTDYGPPVVLAEEDKLRQLLTNLLGNAVRYTPEGTPIEIAVYVTQDGTRARLEIIDHGEGIPEQVRKKIFQRFWRSDASRTRDTGGSGLGLSIVEAIVAANEGEIFILETPGGGATFRVCFPMWKPDQLDSQATKDN